MSLVTITALSFHQSCGVPGYFQLRLSSCQRSGAVSCMLRLRNGDKQLLVALQVRAGAKFGSHSPTRSSRPIPRPGLALRRRKRSIVEEIKLPLLQVWVANPKPQKNCPSQRAESWCKPEKKEARRCGMGGLGQGQMILYSFEMWQTTGTALSIMLPDPPGDKVLRFLSSDDQTASLVQTSAHVPRKPQKERILDRISVIARQATSIMQQKGPPGA